MSFRSRVHFVFFIIFGFVAELFFLGYLATKVLGAAHSLGGKDLSSRLGTGNESPASDFDPADNG
jgi:hypothetical protein